MNGATSHDVGETFRVYGSDDVRKVILNVDELSGRAIKLTKTVLHLTDDQFAFNARPSHRKKVMSIALKRRRFGKKSDRIARKTVN